jgi:hypothetical protein
VGVTAAAAAGAVVGVAATGSGVTLQATISSSAAGKPTAIHIQRILCLVIVISCV